MLLSPNDEGVAETQTGTAPTGADAKAAAEMIKMRERYGELKTEKETLEQKLAQLEADNAKLTRQNEKLSTDLGTYKATEARQAAVKRYLDSPDIKGKIQADPEKIMKYLSRGGFDESKLEAEVREAVDILGVEIVRGSGVSDRGVSTPSTDERASTRPTDPLGAIVVKSFGGA